jgi:hypothetical protein
LEEPRVSLTPLECRALADRLRRVDVAADDVTVVMDAAAALDNAGIEILSLVRHRERVMRNRNNSKRRALSEEVEVVV